MLLALALAGPLWGQAVLKVDQDEFLRHLKSSLLPKYPQKSFDQRHSGTVTATVDVDDKGTLAKKLNIDVSPDVHMAEEVKRVVSQWVFQPFTQQGKGKPAESTIYIQFRLRSRGAECDDSGTYQGTGPDHRRSSSASRTIGTAEPPTCLGLQKHHRCYMMLCEAYAGWREVHPALRVLSG